MHRVNRCTLAGTVWAPTSANRAPAHCYPLPGRPPCRAAARSTRPTIPRAPRPRIRPTARAPALRPLRLHRLRAAPGCPCPSMSPPSRSRAHRPPHRAHRAPTSASRPISLLALRRPQGPDWQEPHRMHPFFAECAKKAPFLATSARNACFSRSGWQHPRPMHPFPGAIGRFRMHGARILPPRALFRVEEPEITHGAKMLPAPPGLSPAAACGMAERALRHATAACGTRHGRTGFAPCGAGLACLPHAPPCHLACVRRGLRLPAISPAFIAAVLYASRFATRIAPTVRRHSPHRPLRSGRAVDQALPAALVLPTPTHRVHRCALAGTARAPTRANRTPALSQPSPARPWSHLRPPAPRHPPRLTLPRGSRCGSGNSREMVR